MFPNIHSKTPVLALVGTLLQNNYGGFFWIFEAANTFLAESGIYR